MKRFEYICLHNTDKGFKIDDFTLFAEVISRTDRTVTYLRYMKFGKLKYKEPITISIEAFNHFYSLMTNEQYTECLNKEKLL